MNRKVELVAFQQPMHNLLKIVGGKAVGGRPFNLGLDLAR